MNLEAVFKGINQIIGSYFDKIYLTAIFNPFIIMILDPSLNRETAGGIVSISRQ